MTLIDNDIMKKSKDSFDNVTKIYEETSALLKDISTLLEEKYNFLSIKGGSAIETHAGSSKSLDWPKWWLLSDAAIRFKPEGQKDNNRLINVTVIFRTLIGHAQQEVTEPRLVVGVLENMGDPIGWLSSAYHNERKGYEYFRGDTELNYCMNHEGVDGEMINFFYTSAKQSSGGFFAMPLLSVKNSNDVEELLGKIVKHWEEKYGKVK